MSKVLRKEYPHFLEYGAEIEALRNRYAEYKIERNYLDCDDLLLYTRLLLEDERVRSRRGNRPYSFPEHPGESHEQSEELRSRP